MTGYLQILKTAMVCIWRMQTQNGETATANSHIPQYFTPVLNSNTIQIIIIFLLEGFNLY